MWHCATGSRLVRKSDAFGWGSCACRRWSEDVPSLGGPQVHARCECLGASWAPAGEEENNEGIINTSGELK